MGGGKVDVGLKLRRRTAHAGIAAPDQVGGDQLLPGTQFFAVGSAGISGVDLAVAVAVAI